MAVAVIGATWGGAGGGKGRAARARRGCVGYRSGALRREARHAPLHALESDGARVAYQVGPFECILLQRRKSVTLQCGAGSWRSNSSWLDAYF